MSCLNTQIIVHSKVLWQCEVRILPNIPGYLSSSLLGAFLVSVPGLKNRGINMTRSLWLGERYCSEIFSSCTPDIQNDVNPMERPSENSLRNCIGLD